MTPAQQGIAWIGLVLAVLGAARTADAVNVLVFNSTRYVDSGQTGYQEGSQESDNVQAALKALGLTVRTIAGPYDSTGACSFGFHQPGTLLATAAEYSAALATADFFLIPEQESWCYLPGEISADIAAVWRNYVASGHGLIIHSSQEAKQKVDDLFSVVFGFRAGAVNGTGVTTTRRATAAFTRFASGPASLPGNDSTGLLPLARLPRRALSVYDNGVNASVVIIPYGSGKIVFLGWDWTKSDPPFVGRGLDGGWFRTLAGAVKEAATSGFRKVLTVAKVGSGTGRIVSSPAGIDCWPGCWAAFTTGAVVRLRATPAAGSRFTGWVGRPDCADGVVTMTTDLVCHATFTAQHSPSTASSP
ncbi:MAG TPA: hypothetical protein VGW35_14085 [Methylomirabilota bacterium]|nr:hypothetical protein [Methylomirabilota bacterium]